MVEVGFLDVVQQGSFVKAGWFGTLTAGTFTTPVLCSTRMELSVTMDPYRATVTTRTSFSITRTELLITRLINLILLRPGLTLNLSYFLI